MVTTVERRLYVVVFTLWLVSSTESTDRSTVVLATDESQILVSIRGGSFPLPKVKWHINSWSLPFADVVSEETSGHCNLL